MHVVRNLCKRGILLGHGRLILDATAGEAVAGYYQELGMMQFGAKTAVADTSLRRGSGAVRFTAVQTEDVHGQQKFEFLMGETVRFRLRFEVFASVPDLHVAVSLKSMRSHEEVTDVRLPVRQHSIPAGYNGEVVVELPELALRRETIPCTYGWATAKVLPLTWSITCSFR